MKCISIVLIALVVCIACEKDANDIVGNKIKSIHTITDAGTEFRYDFYYDNSSRIKDIYLLQNNDTTTKYRINYPNTSTIKIIEYRDGSQLSPIIWNAVVEQKKILSLQSNQNVPQDNYQFIFKDNKLDTAYEVDIDFYIYGLVNYNITYDGRNYLRSMLSYLQYNIVEPARPIYHNNLVENFTYTDIPNNHLLPFQDAAIDNGIWGMVNPLYILGLEGYFAYTPNRNLIATKNGFPFEYVFDQGQVVSMFVPYTQDSASASLGPVEENTYTFTYY